MTRRMRGSFVGAVAALVGLAAVVAAQSAATKPVTTNATVQTGVTPAKPPVTVECPVTQVTVGVETPANLPSPWWDTPFAMTLDHTELTTVGGKPGIRCLYKGSGREWDIARPLEPNYSKCTPQGKSFSCVPK